MINSNASDAIKVMLRLGPLTTAQLAERSGIAIGTIRQAIGRNPELFEQLVNKSKKFKQIQYRLK